MATRRMTYSAAEVAEMVMNYDSDENDDSIEFEADLDSDQTDDDSEVSEHSISADAPMISSGKLLHSWSQADIAVQHRWGKKS